MKFLLKTFIMLAIWVAGCALNHYYFQIKSMSFVMLYGYVVGTIVYIFGEIMDSSQ
tara:strand:+ start:194938 stop:195105 length:168 start_codon:yes stop_codon:yes gene_type:complete